MRFCEILIEDPPMSAVVHPRITVINRAAVGSNLVADLALPSPVAGQWQAIVEIDGRMIDLASVWRAGYTPSTLMLAASDLPDMSAPIRSHAADSPADPPEVSGLSVATAVDLAAPTAPVTAHRPREDRSGRVARTRARLQARRTALARELSEPVPDPEPCSAALGDLLAARAAAPRLAAERAALAEAWEEALARLGQFPVAVAPSPDIVAAANAALDAARRDHQVAQGRLSVAPPDRLEALDLLHAELEQAQRQAQGRFSGSGTRRRVAELELAERSVLDELGFVSYGDRHLTEALRRPDPRTVEQLDAAAARVADAEAVLAELATITADVARRREVEAEAERYRARASLLLGRPLALSDVEVLRTAPDAAVVAAEAALRRVLGALSIPSSHLQAAAEAALAEIDEALVRRDKAEIEWEAVVSDLASLDLPPEPAPSPPAPVPSVAQEAPRPMPIPDAVPAAATSSPDPDAATRDFELFLLARLVGQRHLDGLGAVPLVLDDTFAALPLEVRRAGLALLERMADSVQVIYVTDDADVHAWARFIGPERAALIDVLDLVAGAGPRISDREFAAPGLEVSDIDVVDVRTSETQEATDDVALATPSDELPLAPAIGAEAIGRVHCSWCPNQLATGACVECGKPLCDDHLFRTAGGKRRGGRTFCVPCGLIAAGVKQRVRYR